MNGSIETKLEWACREIEHLSRKVSMLEKPEYWRLEAMRQRNLPIGDPCRTMTIEEVDRILCNPTPRVNPDDSRPLVRVWWIPPQAEENRIGFVVAWCRINGKNYSDIDVYPFANEYELDGGDASKAKWEVKNRLCERLEKDGILTRARSHSNPSGEWAIA